VARDCTLPAGGGRAFVVVTAAGPRHCPRAAVRLGTGTVALGWTVPEGPEALGCGVYEPAHRPPTGRREETNPWASWTVGGMGAEELTVVTGVNRM
jgi:hypothetical protein